MIIKIDKNILDRYINCICFRPRDYYLEDNELENQLNKLVNKLLDIEITKHEAEYKK